MGIGGCFLWETTKPVARNKVSVAGHRAGRVEPKDEGPAEESAESVGQDFADMDEGQPSSYLLLAKDTPVFSSDGGVAGKVKEVLCVPSEDIFEGSVLATGAGDRLLAAELVTAIHERGVDVSIPAAQAGELPLPEPHRRIKYDVVADERPWMEVMRWLHDHLAHLVHPGDARLDGARERLAQRETALD